MATYIEIEFTPPSAKRRRPGPDPRGADLFGLLPDDCAQVVFSYLPSERDRCACAAVCKRWLVLLAHMRGCEFNPFRFGRKYATHDGDKDKEASRCLEAKEANDARLAAMAVGTYARRLLGNLSVRCGKPAQQRVTDFGLHIVSQSFPNLRSLSLWDCFKVGSTGLASIARCCRALEKLDISNSPRIDDDGLVPIARNCRNLSALAIHSCPRVGDRSLLALARCSAHLESISISRCPQVGDAGIVSLVSHLPNLARVRLAQLRLTDATLDAISCHSATVKVLSLEGISGLTTTGLSRVSRLESLRLRSCVALAAPRGVDASCLPGFDALRHVTIRDCRFAAEDVLSQVTASARHLESLRLEKCEWLSTDGLIQAVRNCNHALKILHLADCSNIGKGGSITDARGEQGGKITDVVAVGASLNSITIRNCEGVDDDFLQRIAPFCGAATRISLMGLGSITDRGLLALVGSGPSTGEARVRVSLKGCGKITDWSVAAVAMAFGSRLEALSMEGCRGVGDRGLAVVGWQCGAGLRELDVSGTAVSDEGLVKLVTAEEQKLEVLSVAGCEGVTDTGLGCLEVMCGGLVGLNLQHCAGVTRRGVNSFRAALWWCDVLY